MTVKDNDPNDLPTPATAHQSPLQRWSNRKIRAKTLEEPVVASDVEPTPSPPVLTDADMPPLASLTEDADYRGFLSSGVSEALRRVALRKLFHSPTFNVTDGLDDYAEDFTKFAKLGDVVTQEMRHRLAVEAERIAQSASDDDLALTPDGDPETRPNTASSLEISNDTAHLPKTEECQT
jgi:hypothetical protein